MSYFIAVVIIVIVSVQIGNLFEINVSECIPVSVFAVILWLYVFYISGFLYLGFILLMTLIAGYSLLMFIKARKHIHGDCKNERNIVSEIISPAIFIFLFVAVWAYIYTKDLQVILWDEERLWGAVPKALHTNGTLQLGENAEIYDSMQSYPPAMMIFGYFITAFSKVFHENQLYAGYALYSVCIFMPAISRLQWKQWYFLILFSAIVILAPCLYTSHFGDYSLFYLSLFIDPILGMTAGFLFFEAINEPYSSSFSLLRFCLSLFVLTHLKDSGVEFAACVWTLSVVLDLLGNKENKKNDKLSRIRRFKLYLLPGVVVLFAFSSWRFVLNIYEIENHIPFSLRIFSFSEFKQLFIAIVKKPMISTKNLFGYYYSDIKFSLATALIICLVFGTVLKLLLRDISIKKMLTVQLSMSFAFTLFIYGYVCAFSNSYLQYGELPSFQRYMGSLVACAYTYELMRFMRGISDKVISPQSVFLKRLAGFTVVAFLAIMIIKVSQSLIMWEWNHGYHSDYILEAKKSSDYIINQLKDQVDEKEKVRVCELISGDPADNSMLHQRVYYDMIGTGIIISNYYSETRIAEVNPDSIDFSDTERIKEYARIWSNRVIEKEYDYIFVMTSEKWTECIFEELGFSSDVLDGSLFSVERTDNEYGIALSLYS